MKLHIKITKYFALQAVALVITLLVGILLFLHNIISETTLENKNQLEKRIAATAKHTGSEIQNAIHNIYTRDSVITNHIHKELQKKIETATEKNNNISLKNIILSEKILNEHEYIIYEKMNDNKSLNAVNTSLANVDLKEIDSILPLKTSTHIYQIDIIKKISTHLLVSQLVKIREKIYVITYGGIFDNNNFFIGSLATLTPLDIKHLDFHLEKHDLDLSTTINIIDRYTGCTIYHKSVSKIYNNKKNNTLASVKDIHLVKSLNIEIVSQLEKKSNNLMGDYLKTNTLKVLVFSILIIFILIIIVFIASQTISEKIDNLLYINVVLAERNIKVLDKTISIKKENDKITSLLSKEDNVKYFSLLQENINTHFAYEYAANEANSLKNNLYTIASYLNNIYTVAHKNEDNNEKSEAYLIFQINYLQENLKSFKKINSDYDEIQKIVKYLYFNVNILSEREIINKNKMLELNIDKLYNKIIVTNSFSKRLEEEIIFFEENISEEIKNKLLSLQELREGNKKIISEVQKTKQIFKQIIGYIKTVNSIKNIHKNNL